MHVVLCFSFLPLLTQLIELTVADGRTVNAYRTYQQFDEAFSAVRLASPSAFACVGVGSKIELVTVAWRCRAVYFDILCVKLSMLARPCFIFLGCTCRFMFRAGGWCVWVSALDPLSWSTPHQTDAGRMLARPWHTWYAHARTHTRTYTHPHMGQISFP
jgi:hypothetical protein